MTTRSTPVVSWTLIGACFLVFLWEMSLGAHGHAASRAFGLIPDELLGDAGQLSPRALPPWLTVFTSMFLHGGWTHLIGNLLYLWVFGGKVEERLGRWCFAALYLLCGIAAALAQALPEPDSHVPMVGASGAISGVLGAHLLLFPRAHVLVLLPFGALTRVLRLHVLVAAGAWFGLQLAAPEAAGVAFRAHLGGFAAGLATGGLWAACRATNFRGLFTRKMTVYCRCKSNVIP